MQETLMLEVAAIELSTYQIQLKSRFQTALRSIDNFDVFKLRVELSSGKELLGEVVATPAITGITAEVLIRDVNEFVIPLFRKTSLEDSKVFYSSLALALPHNPTARALGDLTLQSANAPTDDSKIKTDVTIPICEIKSLDRIVEERVLNGFSAFKIKLGEDSLEHNLEKMKTLADLVPGGSILRVDPNQSWSVDYSLKFLESIDSLGIKLQYLEQPVKRDDLDGLSLIRKSSSTEIMADESCFDLKDLHQIIEMQAADWVNIKILKAGGVTPAKEMAEVALSSGLNLSFGCMIESPLGVRAAMQLADQFAPVETHDLDAAWWYLQEKLRYEGGVVQ
jgi:L-Ala-D/L-Glu epimerase